MDSIPNDWIDTLIKRTLQEDLGSAGDLTTEGTVPSTLRGEGWLVGRAGGTVAGLPVAERVFHLVDDSLECQFDISDGSTVQYGEKIGTCRGPLRAILTAERTALNFLQRLSGIATLTSRFVQAVEGTGVRILDTRKTTPQLRALEKYAVRQGGGENHRSGLYDYILIKDNHIDGVGGITSAVLHCISFLKKKSLTVPIEVETRTLEEVRECLDLPIQRIMLDNFTTVMMREAVDLIDGRKEVEASGNMTLQRVREVAETGVDFISVGALTHSVPALDISLVIQGKPGSG